MKTAPFDLEPALNGHPLITRDGTLWTGPPGTYLHRDVARIQPLLIARMIDVQGALHSGLQYTLEGAYLDDVVNEDCPLDLLLWLDPPPEITASSVPPEKLRISVPPLVRFQLGLMADWVYRMEELANDIVEGKNERGRLSRADMQIHASEIEGRADCVWDLLDSLRESLETGEGGDEQ